MISKRNINLVITKSNVKYYLSATMFSSTDYNAAQQQFLITHISAYIPLLFSVIIFVVLRDCRHRASRMHDDENAFALKFL